MRDFLIVAHAARASLSASHRDLALAATGRVRGLRRSERSLSWGHTLGLVSRAVVIPLVVCAKEAHLDQQPAFAARLRRRCPVSQAPLPRGRPDMAAVEQLVSDRRCRSAIDAALLASAPRRWRRMPGRSRARGAGGRLYLAHNFTRVRGRMMHVRWPTNTAGSAPGPSAVAAASPDWPSSVATTRAGSGNRRWQEPSCT